MTILVLYKKKVGDVEVTTPKCKIWHGREVWAKVEGHSERILLRYNAYGDFPWVERFVTPEVFSKIETPRQFKRRKYLEQSQTQQSVA